MRWILMPMLAATLTGCSAVVSTRPFGEAPLDLTEQADKWTGTWQSSLGVCAITVVDATNGVLAMTSTTPKGWGRWSNETERIYVRTGGKWTFASMESPDTTNTVYAWGKIANEGGTILWWMPDPDKFKPLVETGALPGTIEKTIKKKKKTAQPIFPIVGYTKSGEPIYQFTGPSGALTDTFTEELENLAPDMPPDTEAEAAARDEDVPEKVGYCDPANTNTLPRIDDTLCYMVTLGDLEPAHYELIASQTNGVMFYWEAPFVMVKQSRRADLGYLRSAQKRLIHDRRK